MKKNVQKRNAVIRKTHFKAVYNFATGKKQTNKTR